MRRILLTVGAMIILMVMLFSLTGCTLQIETTDNSVSASVDGETTEQVDSILDWVKERIERVFEPSDNGSQV